jgi:ADP-heptose:LPS heptosyltransferase
MIPAMNRKKIMNHIFTHRRIALYGMGEICKSMVSLLQEQAFDLPAILDWHSDQTEYVTRHGNIRIISPNDFANKVVPILICSNAAEGYAEIKLRLEQLGFFTLPYDFIFTQNISHESDNPWNKGSKIIRTLVQFQTRILKFIVLECFRIIAPIVDNVSRVIFTPKERADTLLVFINGIGDLIMWSNMLSLFKAKYAQKKVTFVCHEAYYDLFSNDPFFTKVIPFGRKSYLHPAHRFSFLRVLRYAIFDEAIFPNPARGTERWEWIAKMSLARQKIAMKTYDPAIGEKTKAQIDRLYTHLVEIENRPTHTMQVYTVFVRSVWDPNFQMRWPMPMPELSTQPAHATEPYVVFVLSASDPRRCWPLVNFIELANTTEFPIVLLGRGNLDNDWCDFFVRNVTNPSRVLNLVNKTTLTEYIRKIACAALIIGNDSSAIHIAAATQVPSIVITAGGNCGHLPTHKTFSYFPYAIPYPSDFPECAYTPTMVTTPMDCFGCGHYCKFPVHDSFPCLKMIRVEQVRAVLENKIRQISLSHETYSFGLNKQTGDKIKR